MTPPYKIYLSYCNKSFFYLSVARYDHACRSIEAISFFVNCETQEEVDDLWEKLSEGGEKGWCGWLKDRFGISWQIVPTALGKLLADKDPEKSKRVTEAMLKMHKLDIEKLKQASLFAS